MGLRVWSPMHSKYMQCRTWRPAEQTAPESKGPITRAHSIRSTAELKLGYHTPETTWFSIPIHKYIPILWRFRTLRSTAAQLFLSSDLVSKHTRPQGFAASAWLWGWWPAIGRRPSTMALPQIYMEAHSGPYVEDGSLIRDPSPLPFGGARRGQKCPVLYAFTMLVQVHGKSTN